MYEAIVNFVLIFSGTGLAVIPLFWDIKFEQPIIIQNPIRVVPERKKFTPMGKFFMFLIPLALASGVAKYVYDDKSMGTLRESITSLKVAHATDSMQALLRDERCRKEAEVNAVNYQMSLLKARDSINSVMKREFQGVNTNIDNTNKKVDAIGTPNPVLNIPALYEVEGVQIPNPMVIWDTLRDSGDFTVWITNEMDAVAKDLEITFTEFFSNEKNEEPIRMSWGKARYTKNRKITKKDPYVLSLHMGNFDPWHRFNDLRYVALQVKYKNEKGEMQPYLQVIVKVDKNYINRELPQMQNDLYEKYKKELIQLNYWQAYNLDNQ